MLRRCPWNLGTQTVCSEPCPLAYVAVLVKMGIPGNALNFQDIRTPEALCLEVREIYEKITGKELLALAGGSFSASAVWGLCSETAVQ